MISATRRCSRNIQNGKGFREFSVKELSWCTPAGTPGPVNARKVPSALQTDQESRSSGSNFQPIDKFGVVAAMSKNRIIGLGGKLPWSIPPDRHYFKDLTRNKILIIGRRTYEEESDECHISHCRKCIVISRTSSTAGSALVTPSFSEALHLARELQEELELPEGEVNCWIAGGEKVYTEALHHKSAKVLHLTLVDKTIDVKPGQEVAQFPAKYRWDRHFHILSKSETYTHEGVDYNIVVWNRKQR